MINKFMLHPVGNTLAVIVLVALIVTWFVSLILALRNTPVRTDQGWFAWLLPVFAILGVPATLDLLQTSGSTFFFAGVTLVIFILNIVIPILHLRGKSSQPLVRDWYQWTIPITILAGLIVSGYLTFVETTGAPPVCAPAGSCH